MICSTLRLLVVGYTIKAHALIYGSVHTTEAPRPSLRVTFPLSRIPRSDDETRFANQINQAATPLGDRGSALLVTPDGSIP